MTRPNVILIMADQHRWDFLGYESNGITHTPNLGTIASEGIIFRSAYCSSPLCCPSRAAIASGRYGMNTGCYTNLHQLPPGTPSFVQQFRSNGYHTCAIGKTHMEIHAYDADFRSEPHLQYMDSLGWSEVIEADAMVQHGIKCNYGSFLLEHGVLDDYVTFMEHYGTRGKPNFACQEWTLPERFSLTSFVGDSAVDWLRRWDDAKPFLLHVGFVDPHSPIKPLPRFMDMYRDSEEVLPWNSANSPAGLEDARRGYRALISHVDECVGNIRAVLAEKGMLGNTIVVYVADHGEMAGDHGRTGKTTFFEGSVHVPLLFAGPGINPGKDNSALVEIIDIGRTLCDLCSVEPHAWDQGRSLVPILTGEATTHRDTVYCEMGCDRMLYDGRYKLMWGDPTSDTRKLGRLPQDKPVNIPPSPVGLYDLWVDPKECQNLARDEAHNDLLRAMMETLLIRLNGNIQTQPFLSRGEYRPLRSR